MNPFSFVELLECLENQVLPALSHRLSQGAKHVFKVHKAGAISIKNGKQLCHFFLRQLASKLSESLPKFLKRLSLAPSLQILFTYLSSFLSPLSSIILNMRPKLLIPKTPRDTQVRRTLSTKLVLAEGKIQK